MCGVPTLQAESIVAANEQFTVPTDGKPLRGLIQDHIVGAVLLTKRDTFMDRATFSQLLNGARWHK